MALTPPRPNVNFGRNLPLSPLAATGRAPVAHSANLGPAGLARAITKVIGNRTFALAVGRTAPAAVRPATPIVFPLAAPRLPVVRVGNLRGSVGHLLSRGR